MAEGRIKVLVVDDTIFYRKILSEILGGFADVEVVGTANTGEIALSRIRALAPDLVTLDIEMPYMNGLEVLQHAGSEGLGADFLVVSSKTEKGGAITMEALQLGAFDFVTKPDTQSPEENRQALTKQLRAALNAFARRLELKRKMGGKPPAAKPGLTPPATKPGPAQAAPAPERKAVALPKIMPRGVRNERSHVVAIGISTGGPNALATLLPTLPADLGVPVLLVQHMPAVFTASLAKSLATKCKVKVREAVDGEKVEPNTVYIAPGGFQMKVASGVDLQKVIRITQDPPENNCRPAVDYLFRSVSREYGSKATCVVMTGMGSDGKLGAMVARAGGAVVIAQDESTCVVYGMPKAVVDAGLADVVAPLDVIGEEIRKTL